MVTKSKKKSPKNNYIRKTYRKNRKTNRTRRKTYRKKRRNKLSGGMETQPRSQAAQAEYVDKMGLELEAKMRAMEDRMRERKSQMEREKGRELERDMMRERKRELERERQSYNRIGFELEACFPRPPEMRNQSISTDSVNKTRSTIPCGGEFSAEHAINAPLLYFDTDPDDSIECGKGRRGPLRSSDPPTQLACSMEIVLSDNNVFTYNDKQIYMDDVDITSGLIDEILTVTSMAVPCVEGTCGFHVHISSTDEKYGLDRKDGKIFLLRFLALWCGIEGQDVESEQTKFIKKGYVRIGAAGADVAAGTAAGADVASGASAAATAGPAGPGPAGPVPGPVGTGADAYARLLEPLDRIKFEEVYKLALENTLSGQVLETYILRECFRVGLADVRYHNINIYFFGEGGYGPKSKDLSYTQARPSQRGRSSANPLRIEFRGHKDLMEEIMDNTDVNTESSVAQIKEMLHNYNPEKSRNLAKASRFHDHLMEYLEDINSLFERAKEYEPPL